MKMDFDIIINGAGPSGLCFAAMASKNGLRCAIIEKQNYDAIANPQYDGRDIALTHHSKEILSLLNIWQKFDTNNVSTIDKARVNNGQNSGFMGLESNKAQNLAFVVSNHLVRQFAYDVTKDDENIKIFYENEIEDIVQNTENLSVKTKSGDTFVAKLLIAADSRFSTIRKRFGISASMYDFGKTMVVCRMKHEKPHQNIANECFGEGYTLAMLPLVGDTSSAVITMKPWQIEELLAKSNDEFNHWVMDKFENRLGNMELISQRIAYPLVGVYSNSFIARRFALIGDAAVGMHPVTAHGFNFGLNSIETLMKSIIKAQKKNLDIGGANVLGEYDRKHRIDTLPLYLATKGIVNLYTNDTIPALMARKALINLAEKMAPIKALMMNKLVDDGKNHLNLPSLPLPQLPKLPFLGR
jgi:ubiquinone biosynthesis UbiH/UbiF/VisC/COQ6 family hydroxylase